MARIRKGLEARARILEGAQELARALSVTYGPHGRYVAMDRPGGLLVSKDGVSVAYEIQPEDDLRRHGARTLLQACIKVREEAGDGTTATAILAAGILRRAHKVIVAGEDPAHIARTLRQQWTEIDRKIAVFSKPVTTQIDLEEVAMISSNGDREISKALADVCMRVGKTGNVSVENGYGTGIEIEHRPGFEWDCGPDSTDLIDLDGSERHLDVCLVALVGTYLETFEDVRSILEESSQWPQPLLIVSRRCSGPAVQTLVKNQENVPSCSVRASRVPHDFWDNLEDLAAISGAAIADPRAGRDHRKWDPEWFGSVQYAEIRKDSTSVTAFETEEADDRIMARVRELRQRRDTTEFDFDRDLLDKRMAKLSGGYAVMRVGGVTELARKERRGRIEDCLGSVQAALREGVVPGAGAIFMRMREMLDGGILADALEDPLRVLARNAQRRPDIIVERMYRSLDPDASELEWYGWDARKDCVRHLGDSPMIVDTLTQARAVLEAAVSVAATLLTVEVAIVSGAISRGR